MPYNTDFLYNEIVVIKRRLDTLSADYQHLLSRLDNLYVKRTSYNSSETDRDNTYTDMQNQIRDISRKVSNILLPEETRAYLGVKEIRMLRTGYAELEQKIHQLNVLVETLTALQAKMESRWPIN